LEKKKYGVVKKRVKKGVEKRVEKRGEEEGEKEGEEEAKGGVRHQKMSDGPIGKLTSYIGNLLACFGIEASIPRPTMSPKGPRLLLFDYYHRRNPDSLWPTLCPNNSCDMI
jgi:hypothetical protein